MISQEKPKINLKLILKEEFEFFFQSFWLSENQKIFYERSSIGTFKFAFSKISLKTPLI